MAAISRFCIVVVLAVLTASRAFGDTVAETAARWGLLGTWKLDCGSPTSRSNPALIFVVRQGKVFHDRDFGDAQDSHSVVNAKITSGGSIEIVIDFTSFSQVREMSLIKGGEGRKRAFSNRNVNTGEYIIRDGKFLANGAETRWQNRCR